MKRYLLLVAGLLMACSQHIDKPADAAPTPVESAYGLSRDIVFTPADWPQPLRADIYTPDLAAPEAGFPAVVLIHGGAWARGDREQVQSLAERIAARGYVVMNLTYRFAPANLFPAQVQDVQQAVLWLRANAKAQRVDATRIGGWGYSAGAHLAAMLAALSPGDALYQSDTKIQALVAGGSPVDLRKFQDGYLVPRFLGVTYPQNPQRFADASPAVFISKDDPPVFLYHGAWDNLVPLDQSTDYKADLDKAGIATELFLIGGHGHISAFFFDDEAVQAGLEFLDRHLR